MSESAEAVFKKGSKTFSIAARFFKKEQWNSCCLLYFWCRYCDDIIDKNNSGKDINKLIIETDEIWNGTPHDRNFLALQEVVKTYNVPSLYPAELLEGMRMDLQVPQTFSFSELRLYCYRVASTVGLMMCHIMGIFDVRALRNAAYLGMAMQMTNIARDILEDRNMGRVYLPREWLSQYGLNAENILKEENKNELFEVVRKLIKRSETYYGMGLQGLKDLPLRPAFAVLTAAVLYRQIGREILRRGPDAIKSRTVVSFPRKILLIIGALMTILFSLPGRSIRKASPVWIDKTWSFS